MIVDFLMGQAVFGSQGSSHTLRQISKSLMTPSSKVTVAFKGVVSNSPVFALELGGLLIPNRRLMGGTVSRNSLQVVFSELLCLEGKLIAHRGCLLWFLIQDFCLVTVGDIPILN